MGSALRLTPDQVAEALTICHGGRQQAAKHLGCDRRTVTRYISEHPEVRRAAGEAVEATKDVAEDALIKAVESGEAWAVCFYLKCKAKDRGYIERVQNENGNRGDFDEVRGETSMIPSTPELIARMRQRLGELSQPVGSNGNGNGHAKN